LFAAQRDFFGVRAFVGGVSVVPGDALLDVQMRTLPALGNANSTCGLVAGARYEHVQIDARRAVELMDRRADSVDVRAGINRVLASRTRTRQVKQITNLRHTLLRVDPRDRGSTVDLDPDYGKIAKALPKWIKVESAEDSPKPRPTTACNT
jgi:hypothetical protein